MSRRGVPASRSSALPWGGATVRRSSGRAASRRRFGRLMAAPTTTPRSARANAQQVPFETCAAPAGCLRTAAPGSGRSRRGVRWLARCNPVRDRYQRHAGLFQPQQDVPAVDAFARLDGEPGDAAVTRRRQGVRASAVRRRCRAHRRRTCRISRARRACPPGDGHALLDAIDCGRSAVEDLIHLVKLGDDRSKGRRNGWVARERLVQLSQTPAS